MNAKTPVQFGPYQLDPSNACVWQGKQALSLRPKAFAVLRYLLDHAGQLVTKDELFDTVWPGVYVTDGALKECVREIRNTLGDKARQPQYVETVHRRGYRFIAAVTTSPAPVRSPESGVQSPHPPHLSGDIVGRDGELGQLQDWLGKSLRGERQIIFLTGEAGIGKTTVLQAFINRIARITQTSEIWTGLGQCIEQYGAGEAYLPVLEALGRLCRQDKQLIDVLSQHAPSWLVQMPALLETSQLEALQARLAGLTQERMLREMAEAMEVLTVQHPLILALEDVQWSDTATVELIAALARRHEPARLLIIATYRPGDALVQDHPFKKLQHELQMHGQCQEMLLSPLSQEAVGTYLTHRFPDSPLPIQLASPLYQQTEGNPLFLVNTVDYLARQGLVGQANGGWQLHNTVQDITAKVPDTLQQIIERQIDYLPPQHQQLLDVASIAGATFSAAAVAAGLEAEVVTVETQCETLARQEQFIQTTGIEEWPNGTVSSQFAFQHGLYQEVLYDRVGAARNRQLHRRIGDRKEAGYGDQAKTIAGQLAVHFQSGRDHQRAVRYLHLAGERASQLSANTESIAHLNNGLALLPRLPDTPERAQQELLLHVTLGPVLMATQGYGSPEAERVYTQARALCSQVGETRQLLPVLWGLFTFYAMKGDLPTARKLGEQFIQLAERVQDAPSLLLAYRMYGNGYYWQGQFTSALDYLDRGIIVYDPQQHHKLAFQTITDSGVFLRGYAAGTLWMLGYPTQALKRLHEALHLAQDLAHTNSLAYALIWAVTVNQLQGDIRAVSEQAETLMSVSREAEFSFGFTTGTFMQGWTLVEQGQAKEGLEQLRQGLAARRMTNERTDETHLLMVLAQAYGRAGQAEEGLLAVNEGLDLVEQTGRTVCAAELHRLKGALTLQQFSVRGSTFKGIEEDVETSFLKALEVARQQEAKAWELRASMSLAKLWQRQGKTAEAYQLLSDVYGWFTEGSDSPHLQEARALLEELSGF